METYLLENSEWGAPRGAQTSAKGHVPPPPHSYATGQKKGHTTKYGQVTKYSHCPPPPHL